MNRDLIPITISPETQRYWADTAYAAALDAERDAENAAYFADHDARVRAEQEWRWADDLPDMELRA